jgi:VanZ family protein
MIPVTLWRISFWLCLGLTAYLSMIPQEFLPSGINIWDKFSHFIAFAALAMSAALGWPKRDFFRSVLIPLLIFGVLIEIIQYFIPGREFSLLDMLADAVGIIIVWIGVSVLQSVSAKST